ncbi:MAG: DUF748 domain-containing protein, partial [Planctomycetes bacterium]|nr:DUF748 domain-containing protein [Planctomycetota bacterium]
LRVPESLESLVIEGTIKTCPEDMGADLDLNAEGMRAGPLEAYLPENIAVSLNDGRFSAALHARLVPNKEGGQQAGILVQGIDYRDGGEELSFLNADSLKVELSRFDPEGLEIDLEEISLSGLAMNMRRDKEGVTHLLGLSLPPKAKNTGNELSELSPKPEERAKQDLPVSSPETPVGKKAPAKWGERLPLVTLNRLDLHLESLNYLDEMNPSGPTFNRAALRLRNLEPIRLLGEDPEEAPPVNLALDVQVIPGMESFLLKAELLPFADEPGLILDLKAEGLDIESLAGGFLDPEGTLECGDLHDGSLQGRVEAHLKAKRRHALDFDLQKGFGFELELKDFIFQDEATGRVLAGLDGLYLDAARIMPGESRVDLRSLEITKPRGFVTKEEDGLHLLGLVIKTPEADLREPEPEPETESETEKLAAAEPAPPQTGADLNLDKFFLTDIDFTFQDLSVAPPMYLPLRQLDIEVRDLTSRALTEHHPISFNVLMGSGKVPLPPPSGKGGFFAGLGESVAGLVAGKDETALEERPLFDEIALSGKIALKPRMQGWVKAGIHALELGNFKGSAGAAGVTLEEGILDSEVNLRFQEDGSMDTQAGFTFTDLDLSEGADGPISRYLKLPAPLDVVLFLLRDEDGAIEIPLDFEMGADGLSAAAIAQTSVTVLSSLIADAVASSPFRVAGTVTDLIPLGGGEEEEDTGEPLFVLAFQPGDAYLTSGARQGLQALVERLEQDEEREVTLRHELGRDDLEIVTRLANPDQEDCLALSLQLRNRKRSIEEERETWAARAQAFLAAGQMTHYDQTVERLRYLDQETSLTDRALDQVFARLRPGAERQAPRRSRVAALALGQARMEAVYRFLADSGLENPAERVRIIRPRIPEEFAMNGGVVGVY